MRRRFVHVLKSVTAGALALTMVAAVNSVTPSTNDANRDKGWAHTDKVAEAPGEATFDLISTRGFASCFEYRTDGDTSQVVATNGGENWNPDVTDGLYPYKCVANSTQTITVAGDEYVEIRMVFGAETDERFDWTRFELGQYPDPETADDCKDGGWVEYGFRNQGQCIKFVNTGEDSR